ncbi:MAG: hypothetical protein F4186_08740 [Boseongicola sp. SB0676_bin_33]|nr:hypothetical protein [Boseongicola sp. SB0676_bin_33]
MWNDARATDRLAAFRALDAGMPLHVVGRESGTATGVNPSLKVPFLAAFDVIQGGIVFRGKALNLAGHPFRTIGQAARRRTP